MSDYSNKMKQASKILFEDKLYDDFEPKSIWEMFGKCSYC